MVTLYTSPSCTSCRKARGWLRDHQIPFTERNIFADPLTMAEIKNILRMTENGTEDIISKRSKAYRSLKIDVDDLPIDGTLRIDSQDPWFVTASDHH